jgi:hypothetical protein
VIDCAAKIAARLIITGGGWQSRCGRVRGGPSRRAGGDWRLPRYALPRPTDELLHERDLDHLCYHDSQSWPGGWWRGGASDIAKKHVCTHILLTPHSPIRFCSVLPPCAEIAALWSLTAVLDIAEHVGETVLTHHKRAALLIPPVVHVPEQNRTYLVT